MSKFGYGAGEFFLFVPVEDITDEMKRRPGTVIFKNRDSYGDKELHTLLEVDFRALSQPEVRKALKAFYEAFDEGYEQFIDSPEMYTIMRAVEKSAARVKSWVIVKE